MNLTFDPRKAATNLHKHGVSFGEAATCFLDPLYIEQRDEAHSHDQERWQMLGTSTRARPFVIYTQTASTVRLISARVATATERK